MTAEQNTFKGSTEYVASQELMAAVQHCHAAAEAAADQGGTGNG